MFLQIVRKSVMLLGLVLVVGVALTGAYFNVLKPERAHPVDIKIASTPERLARGKYLFTLAGCDGCHSQRDFSHFGGPVVEAGRGRGNVFPPELGLPGTVVARNITPDLETGIGTWTDGEKIRAIREGIDKSGRPLFPMMPYESFRNLSDEDVYSLVAYLNTLPPVKNSLPRTKVDFPASMLVRTAPRPVNYVPEPDRANRIAYGRYLVNLAGCMDCHTPKERGRPLPGMLLAGGEVFRFPGATVVSANITPDEQTGIGRWKEADFVDRIYQYREYALKGSPSVGPESFTMMPWLEFATLPEDDLKAIYAFLRTQKPVYHYVETHPGYDQVTRLR